MLLFKANDKLQQTKKKKFKCAHYWLGKNNNLEKMIKF